MHRYCWEHIGHSEYSSSSRQSNKTSNLSNPNLTSRDKGLGCCYFLEEMKKILFHHPCVSTVISLLKYLKPVTPLPNLWRLSTKTLLLCSSLIAKPSSFWINIFILFFDPKAVVVVVINKKIHLAKQNQIDFIFEKKNYKFLF